MTTSDQHTSENAGVTPDLVAQLEATLWLPHDLDPAIRKARLAAARAMLEDIAPGDGIEGMLAVQMVATHEAAMACLGRSAAPGASPEQTDQNLKHAERLLAIYTRQIDVLDRHRVREIERQQLLENRRDNAERRAFLDSVAPTQEMVFQSLLDFARENQPDEDEFVDDDEDDYEEIHIDMDAVRRADAGRQGTNGAGAGHQEAPAGRHDPDGGDG
jgi:hypothetical protein